MLWHIGNTTVRTPYRLRDALYVLQGTSLNGNISGRTQENAFATLLHDKKVLNSSRLATRKDASDLGRKWRSALSQLGFITPQFTHKNKSGTTDSILVSMIGKLEGLSGRSFEITPNGYRLIQAKIITAQQECFLRSLAIYRIPSLIEKRYDSDSFSPLHFILCIINGLNVAGYSTKFTFQEFALFVQTATPIDGLDSIIQNIVSFREGRHKAKGNVRAYDREHFENIAMNLGCKLGTLGDYADLSFRYLKATGLFRNIGKGIMLSPFRTRLAVLLRDEENVVLSDQTYLHTLWLGVQFPTDNAVSSHIIVSDLASQLRECGIKVQVPPDETSLIDLEIKRHELEAMLLQLDEQKYAAKQVGEIDEIMVWMQAILNRRSAKLINGDTVVIPKGEGPAYLEWVIWRSFLAIDNLCNEPWEARRFQIDQDFLPVHCAPGGGPDMVFEFENVIIVVEVTLTNSSRQEATEGEPVRRHVAQYAKEATKPVYGLFIALEIDTNTAHRFRSGDWYLSDDSKISLDIVPMTLEDFKTILASGQNHFIDVPVLLHQLMIECRAKANQDAPQWKASISSIIKRITSK